MVTTNDEAVWRAMWAYMDHGKSYAGVYERQHPRVSAGCTSASAPTGACWRYRPPSFASSCGVWASGRGSAQPTRRPSFRPAAVRAPELQVGSVHAYYNCYGYVQVQHLAIGWGRDRIVDVVNARGVPAIRVPAPKSIWSRGLRTPRIGRHNDCRRHTNSAKVV